MSRNIGQTHCKYCFGDIVLVEHPRNIKKEEAGVYFGEYKGLKVANAECEICCAKYLAWMEVIGLGADIAEWKIRDLSFRSTFDDEPGPKDVPTRKIINPNLSNTEKFVRVMYGDDYQFCKIKRGIVQVLPLEGAVELASLFEKGCLIDA